MARLQPRVLESFCNLKKYLLSIFFSDHTLLREFILQWTPKLRSLSFAWLPLKVMADISNLGEIRALPLYQMISERIKKYKLLIKNIPVETQKP